MKLSISLPPDSEILQWALPDRLSVVEKHRKGFDDRVLALQAVVSGSSIQAASIEYDVDRTTLTTMVRLAPEPAWDGCPYGFRVCIPWYRKVESTVTDPSVPTAAAPHAFRRLLVALPAVMSILAAFKGRLPAHNHPSTKFEALFRQFKKLLKDAGHENKYPLNGRDKGRRAVQNWLKRVREEQLELTIADNDEQDVSIKRLDRILQLQPLDRVEFDGHQIDNDWYALVPTRDGQWTAELVSSIWILAIIDAVSLAVIAWTLVIGRAYNRLHVLETFAKALTPWQPRNLIVPTLRYVTNAWMPTRVEKHSDVLRVVCSALDNALAHSAKITTENLGDHQLGVANLGYPNVPEGRPNIESFFKRIEECILRFLAGGYRPAKGLAKKENVSGKSGRDYPVHMEALKDLLDVEISAYNVTPHAALQNRTPREVFEAHLNNGMWTTQSSLTLQDSTELLALRANVVIRGSRDRGILPHVTLEGARYRSVKLNARYDLVGRKFKATLNIHAFQQMSLWDDDGNLFVVLNALPPWHSTHSLELRQSALRCCQRGIFQINGTDDACPAYHAFVREKASELEWATDEYVKHGFQTLDMAHPKGLPRSSTYTPTDTLSGLLPRGGRVDLTKRRKT